MTREEIFSVFPRPWRLHGDGTVVDASGAVVLQVDVENEREDDDVTACAELVVDLVNEAEQ